MMVFAESSGEFRVLKAQESCAFLAILISARPSICNSRWIDKSGEATSATVDAILLPGFFDGNDGMRHFRWIQKRA